MTADLQAAWTVIVERVEAELVPVLAVLAEILQRPASAEEMRELATIKRIVSRYHTRRKRRNALRRWLRKETAVIEYEDAPYVCPGCHAVAGPCRPGCIDAEIERDRHDARGHGDEDEERFDDED